MRIFNDKCIPLKKLSHMGLEKIEELHLSLLVRSLHPAVVYLLKYTVLGFLLLTGATYRYPTI